MLLYPSCSSREWDFGRRMARIPRRLDCEHSSEVALIINYELFILQTDITFIANITITAIEFLRLIWIIVIRRSYTFRLSSYRL